ncbi:GtrA family protein [Devosia sp. SD17-2]|uniref:GtrA family protein n=1 Tax=Devosia sp. SD17-2 TaxID=2976459 RepID=UPI0023D80C8F|nr:GtrA family protein [Devosia sp. SD17-2]WEJ32928.1 GtrA family protein [Devosia sp. SD17-2]
MTQQGTGTAETARQAGVFALVGLVATGVHYVVALALSLVMPVVWANPFGFLVAFSVSYFGHGRLTFRLKDGEQHHRKRLPRFAAAATAGFLIGQGLLMALRATTPLPDWLALGIALGVVPVFTFAVSKIWVFGSRTDKLDGPQ